jgi:hypothetical protein
MDEPRLDPGPLEQDAGITGPGPFCGDEECSCPLEHLPPGRHLGELEEQRRVRRISFIEPRECGIRLQLPPRPDIGPGQAKFQRAVGGIRGEGSLQQWNAFLIPARIDERPAAFRVGAAGDLLDHRPVERPFLPLLERIGRRPPAERSLHVPRRPLERGRLLRLRDGLAEQVAALLVVESVEEGKPGSMLEHARGIGLVLDGLAKKIAGVVEPQLLFGAFPQLVHRVWRDRWQGGGQLLLGWCWPGRDRGRHAVTFPDDPWVAGPRPVGRIQECQGLFKPALARDDLAMLQKQHWVVRVAVAERAIGSIRLWEPIRPGVRPGQPERQWSVRRVGGDSLLEQGNPLREVACIDERRPPLGGAACCGLFDHHAVKRPLRLLLRLVGRPPLTKLPFDLSGRPLHGRRLLRGGNRLPQQVTALLIVEPIEKQKPRGMLGDARRRGILAERLPEEVAGLVEPQLPFRLQAAFEGGRSRHRGAGEGQRHEAHENTPGADHAGLGSRARSARASAAGIAMPRSSPWK